MMTDLDKWYGGGWTMVGRGVGNAMGCWGKPGGQDCNANSMTNTRLSFLYKDQTINGIPHDTIWYQGFGTVKGNYFYKVPAVIHLLKNCLQNRRTLGRTKSLVCGAPTFGRTPFTHRVAACCLWNHY